MDPANPSFYPSGCYLTSEDATWIDIIHMDMGGYGSSAGMGTAEYYANGGTRPQPGCKLGSIPLSENGENQYEYAIVISLQISICCPIYYRQILAFKTFYKIKKKIIYQLESIIVWSVLKINYSRIIDVAMPNSSRYKFIKI